MDEIITPVEFEKRYGFKPQKQGGFVPSQNSYQPSSQPSFQQGSTGDEIITPAEFEKRYGFKPQKQGGSIPSQGGSSSYNDTPQEPVSSFQPSKFVQELEDWRPDYSEGTGKDIVEGAKDLGMGAFKGITRFVPHLIQGLTPDAMWGENSLLNSESERAKSFRSATTGKTGLQKIGATGFDIASIAGGGGIASGITKGVQTGSLAARFAPTLMEAGKAGKAARFATKIPGFMADTAISNAILNKGEVTTKDNALGLAGALVLPTALKGAGNVIKRTTMGAEKHTASKVSKIAEDIGNYATKEGKFNPAAYGENIAQPAVDFKKGVKELITTQKQRNTFNRGTQKLNALGNTTDDDIIDVLYKTTGSLGKNVDGVLDTTGVVDKISSDNIKPIADRMEQAFAASNSAWDNQKFWRSVENNITDSSMGTAEKKDIAKMINIMADGEEGQVGQVGQSSVLDLFKNSQYLRGKLNFDKYDPAQASNNALKKRIMSAYDDVLRNNLKDIDANVINDGFKEMTKYYDTISFLRSFGDVKSIKGLLPDSFAKLFGVIGGGGAGGFVGSNIGYEVAPRINQLMGDAKFTSTLNNSVHVKLSELFNQKPYQKLLSRLDTEIAKATKGKTEAQAVMASNKAKKEFQKEVFNRIKFNKDRILTENEINKFFKEMELSKSEDKFNTLKAMFDADIAKQGTQLKLPSKSRPSTLPLQSVNGKKVIRLTSPETVKGSSLRDYLR